MKRAEFLEWCSHFEMFFSRMWDLGAIMHSERTEERWFRELCSDDWNCHGHPSMKFLEIENAEDCSEDEYYSAIGSVIVAMKKFGYIAELNIPRRTYIAKDTFQTGGLYSVPCFYAETVEELYDLAVDFAKKQQKAEIAAWKKKQTK